MAISPVAPNRSTRPRIRRTILCALALAGVVAGGYQAGRAPHGTSWDGRSVAYSRPHGPVVSARGTSWD